MVSKLPDNRAGRSPFFFQPGQRNMLIFRQKKFPREPFSTFLVVCIKSPRYLGVIFI